jgi:8-amino-7-oxononanoate synthase
MNDRWKLLTQEVDALQSAGLKRFERSLSQQGTHPEVLLAGKPVIDFSSNHYLGLGTHPAVINAFRQHAPSGAGSFASRLIGGTTPSHLKLEEELAAFKETEDAVLFGSGFLANSGAIAALVGPGDVVFSDALNHASIVDGCRLSRAKIVVYPHNDPSQLKRLLQEHAPNTRRRLLVTDSVFSMDGDEAPLLELSLLAQEFDAFLYVDEAHATGVYGAFGKGLAHPARVTPDIAMGTLSKALGCYGAFIAGPKVLCDFLRNRARSYVFTTSVPPALVASASAALHLAIHGDLLRQKLWENNRLFRAGLKNLGISVPIESKAPIIPILIGGPQETMAASARLLERGIFAHGIRPPTVPPGTGRLRFTILASHTAEHLERALDALRGL